MQRRVPEPHEQRRSPSSQENQHRPVAGGGMKSCWFFRNDRRVDRDVRVAGGDPRQPGLFRGNRSSTHRLRLHFACERIEVEQSDRAFNHLRGDLVNVTSGVETFGQPRFDAFPKFSKSDISRSSTSCFPTIFVPSCRWGGPSPMSEVRIFPCGLFLGGRNDIQDSILIWGVPAGARFGVANSPLHVGDFISPRRAIPAGFQLASSESSPFGIPAACHGGFPFANARGSG